MGDGIFIVFDMTVSTISDLKVYLSAQYKRNNKILFLVHVYGLIH